MAPRRAGGTRYRAAMHRLLLVALLACVAALAAACGASSGDGTEGSSSAAAETTAAATTAAAAADAEATTAPTTAAGACSDEALTLVVQQEIETLNAMTTDLSRDLFLTKEQQEAGIQRVQAELDQLKQQEDALDVCVADASEAQQALLEPAQDAIVAIRALAQETLGLVRGRTIMEAQKALRTARPKMEKLSDTLTRALAALSTQWEAWKLDHPNG